MSHLRALITQTLDAAGVYLDDARFNRTRLDAAAAARQHLRPTLQRVRGGQPDAVAASVGLSLGAITRMFGHGWQQAAGFAALAEVRPHRVVEVARLGALLNVGIVLFDHLVDTFPERRALLADRLSPELLTAPSVAPAELTGDPGVDSIAALALAVMSGAGQLGGRAGDIDRFHQLIAAMYQGELISLRPRGADEPPAAGVWEALSAKSVLPAAAVATLAKLANPAASDSIRTVVDRAAALVGEAFWIVDDLADASADWESGGWSRPVWLLRDRPGEIPVRGQDAVQRLLESGIAAAEAERLARVLTELAALLGSSRRALLRPVQAAVRSWVEGIPPQP